ncbi:hypothetical protein SLE2022_249010 [Rubroshorea leprosula]
MRVKPVDSLKAFFEDDYYMCRFQEQREIEVEFGQIQTEELMKEFLTYKLPNPLCFPKGTKPFKHPWENPVIWPPWLSKKDI